MIKVIITGARGRMGHALAACSKNFADIEIVGQLNRGDDLNAVISRTDVVIDFSTHTATPLIAEICAKSKKGIVIGTTGHSEAERKAIAACQSSIPMVCSSNFSTGVNTLFWLTRKAAEILGPDYDVEIVEMHHRMKKDAPSGTARTLLEILAGVRKLPLDMAARHGRSGNVGVRTPSEIGIHAIRGGDVVGDHTVIFANTGERLELGHKASSRETFASGALRAALWVVNQKPGIYDMQHVLGLE